MRVGLALGAGGILGAAWMIGALDALERDGGLRPAQLAEILATSVGSLIAVMVAAGVPTDAMAAYAAGESGGALEPLENHDATALTLTRLPLSPRPGSLSMALRARGGAGRLTALLPRGVVSTEGIASLVRRVVGERWPEAVIRVVACEYASGERVELGPGREPACPPGAAVAASCAIPGFYAPVAIGGRVFVDGGIHSHSNLDLLAGSQLDAVIAVNPMSAGAWVGGGGLRERAAALRRRRSAARLEAEAQLLRARAGSRSWCSSRRSPTSPRWGRT